MADAEKILSELFDDWDKYCWRKAAERSMGDGSTFGSVAIAAISAAGLKVVGAGFVDAMRNLPCPPDGRLSIGECCDAKTCGCTIGLYLAAPPATTQGERE